MQGRFFSLSRRRGGRVAVAGILSVTLGVGSPAAAQPATPPPVPPATDNPLTGNEITPAMQESVQRGLAWLAQQQLADGSFGQRDSFGARSAITALAGLAFMSAGNLPGRGKYGENVDRSVRYLLGAAQESGLLANEQAHGIMYSHGFATLFLAEVYGMTGDEQVKEKLQKAVRLIQRTQNPEGGWRYTPAPLDADISVTITQVMALRAARDAGIKVEKEVIDRAVEYVRRCQNPDGGFSYMARSSGMGGSAFPRSAAGVATLYYAGIYEGDEIARGLAYVQRSIPRGGAVRGESHYYYGHYYAVQAMFMSGGEAWAKWFPAIRDELIRRQNRAAGNWSGEISDEYATAMALIILQMPNRYLPVFSGKGPGS
jgi:hypothetical protein